MTELTQPPPITQPPPSVYLNKSSSQSIQVLLDPDEVIEKYPKLRNISHIGRLAVRLAAESYFGKEVLRKSTVHGLQGHQPLPEDQIRALKKKIISIHPKYIDMPVEFEPLWAKCVNAINHHASGLRKREQIGLNPS